MNKLSAILDELTTAKKKKRDDDGSGRTPIDINASIAIAKKLIEREGGESNEDEDDAIEKRHFGYSILQRLLSSSTPTPAARESEEEAMVKNEFMNIISNELQLTSRGGSKVPYPLKSKVAQITAEFIKREGSTAWIAFSETIARMLRSTDAYECELGAIIARYVAEDVALHSDEVFADNVRDLLGGMTQTIGEVTRAMREAWERHFSSSSNNNNNFASLEMQKASENCALAVLEAVSVYAEWAPLVPLVRSGLVDICCVALLVRLILFVPLFSRLFFTSRVLKRKASRAAGDDTQSFGSTI
jgi:exportin-5